MDKRQLMLRRKGRLYHLNNSGIYVNPDEVTENLNRWRVNTPNKVKSEQLSNAAVTLFGIGIVLIFLSDLLRE